MSTAFVDERSVRDACERILETFSAKQVAARDHLMAERRRSAERRWFISPPPLSMADRIHIAAIGKAEIATANELIDLCDVAETFGDSRIALSSRHARILKPYLKRNDDVALAEGHASSRERPQR